MIKHLKCLLIALLLFCISVSASAVIRIYGLQDFNLGRWVLGAGSIRANANLCVAVRPRGPYQITAYGQGSGNSFVLSDAGVNLPFRVFYNDRRRPNGAQELNPGQALGGLRARRGSGIRRPCGRPNANITVLVAESNLSQLPAGRYRGSLVLVVGPE
ncbi:MAG: hypothetical protein AAF304_00495 [Pseudomonadota bacterium]